jgi:hypothetical protein
MPSLIHYPPSSVLLSLVESLVAMLTDTTTTNVQPLVARCTGGTEPPLDRQPSIEEDVSNVSFPAGMSKGVINNQHD